METIESILRDVTAAYIKTNIVKGRENLATVESDLMAAVTAECMYHNNIRKRSGMPRITVPKRLDFQQIAQILCAAMHVLTIRVPGSEKPELMAWDGRVYKPDHRRIQLAALTLNGRLSRVDLGRIIERMELLAEPAEPYAGSKFIAYENGILATESGPYMPFEGHMLTVTAGELCQFTPELVFLSVHPEKWDPRNADKKMNRS